VQLLALFFGCVEVLVPCLGVQGGAQKADGQEREPVQGDIHPFGAAVGMSQGVDDEPGGNGRKTTTAGYPAGEP
jgi:hypothetical protein